MEKLLAIMTREIANLPDDMQVELFRTIANFPAITFPILEMTSNHLAGVFESSRGVPLEKPHARKRLGEGESSGTVNPKFERHTRATEKRAIVEVESGNDTSDSDKEVEEEAFEDKRPTVKVNSITLQLQFIVFLH